MSTFSQLEQTVSANSSRGFLHHAVRAFRLPQTIAVNRTLTKHFFGRTLENRFQGSVLGPLWVLIHPVFLFAVYFVVFGLLMGRGGDQPPLTFALYLFTGLMVFHSITQASNNALTSISQNANLVKKVKFPCELLPAVPAFVESTVALVGLAVACLVGVLTGEMQLGWELLLLPWFLVVLVTLTTGLSLLLANANVFYADIRNLYGIFSTAWFFLSPNFWPPSFVHDLVPGITPWLAVNPAYNLLLAERQIFGLDRPEMMIQLSVVENLSIATLWALVLMTVGYGSFMAQKHKYADLV